MSKEVEKFDPSKLMQGVKDRVKATFVALIPDIQWDEMVKKEIDAFFNKTSKLEISNKHEKDNYWNKYLVTETEQSPFRAIIWKECLKYTTEKLKEDLTKELFEETYNSETQRYDTKDKLKSIIEDAIPIAITKFFSQIAFSMTANLRNEINNIYH